MTGAQEEKGTGEGNCCICGLPARSGTSHCSVSCSLANRIPLGKGALPVSWELFYVMGSLFVLFNQLLFLVMGGLRPFGSETPLRVDFQSVSIVAGILWLGLAVSVWLTGKPKSRVDYCVAALAVILLFFPAAGMEMPVHLPIRLGFVNLLISICLYRGVFYLWRRSKKREK